MQEINASDINPSTGKAYAINPDKGVWDDEYFDRMYGNQNRAIRAADPINQAQRALDFQKAANAPVVATLQKSGTDLQSKYSDLVASIKGQGQVLSDKQTLATNNELGKRGISSDSGLYQQEQVNSQLPITSSINSQLAQTGMSQQQDLTQLALQIAQLQAGDVPGALQFGQNYNQQFQQAQQFAQDLALRQDQANESKSEFDRTYQLQQQQANKADTSIVSVGGHNKLVNTQTGQVIADLGASGSGSGSSPALKPSDYMTALNGAITGKNTLSQIFNAFSPYIDPSKIVTQYNALSPYGPAKESWAQALVKQPSQSQSDADLLQSLINGY